MEFYVFTSNKSTKLARDLHLDGEWEVAVTEAYSSVTETLLLISDFVDTSLIDDRSIPLLRRIHQFNTEFHKLYYIPVVSRYISTLNIDLLDTVNYTKLNIPIQIVLHFRRRLIRLC